MAAITSLGMAVCKDGLVICHGVNILQVLGKLAHLLLTESHIPEMSHLSFHLFLASQLAFILPFHHYFTAGFLKKIVIKKNICFLSLIICFTNSSNPIGPNCQQNTCSFGGNWCKAAVKGLPTEGWSLLGCIGDCWPPVGAGRTTKEGWDKGRVEWDWDITGRRGLIMGGTGRLQEGMDLAMIVHTKSYSLQR